MTASTAAIAADPAASATTNLASFIRFVPDGNMAGRVETAAKSYARSNGVTVLLFGAVHVGDPVYYQELEKQFSDCDALLYEMVRDPEAQLDPQVSTDNPVSQLQLGMKRMLDLEFQLEAVDYSRTNFVHADLDPETFFRLQRERQESLVGLMLRAVIEEQQRQRNATQEALSSLRFFMALFNPERSYALKLAFARQMDQVERMIAGIDQGADGQGSVLVSARNEHAMKVLHQQIAKGHRKLGIFYGAGHMPDFERRLEQDGFRKRDERWLTAWDVRPKTRSATGAATEETSGKPRE